MSKLYPNEATRREKRSFSMLLTWFAFSKWGPVTSLALCIVCTLLALIWEPLWWIGTVWFAAMLIYAAIVALFGAITHSN